MSMNFRIHPSIGFARVGNSEEYNLAPETIAALSVPERSQQKQHGGTLGGLPLKADGVTTITNHDIRDRNGKLKRQAARFRVFAYSDSPASYPSGGGEEITVGCIIDGKTVRDIIWTVHVANKKANSFQLEASETVATPLIAQYEDGRLPPLRNLQEGQWANDPTRIGKLTIDPGPRAIRGTFSGIVGLDRSGTATYEHQAKICDISNYPKLFPQDSFESLYEPDGPIESLGQLCTDDVGRLHVIAGYGRAVSWHQEGTKDPYPLNSDVDNDGWFDDTADGPVNAVIVFDDNSTAEVAGAWVVSTDPGYAPQTLNSVSLWDDIYDTWVRKLSLEPELFSDGQFRETYRPDFAAHLLPFFRSAAVQRWNTNLPEIAIRAHDAVGQISEDDDPATTVLAGLGYIRNPNTLQQSEVGAPLMPLSLGDSGDSFLSCTKTQYFLLEQWNAGNFNRENQGLLGPGEYLDKASLINCLGGRFSPGIDMTFIVRQPGLWERERARTSHGPFRIRQKRVDYQKVPSEGLPFLSEGWVPCHAEGEGLEPGDTSKFMSIPWHTDYNSCATHTPSPNLPNNSTLYWSWPAQRPVAVNVAVDTLYEAPTSNTSAAGRLPGQRWSLRGPGTHSPDFADVGRYQNREEFVRRWSEVGTVIQRTQIEGLLNQSAIDALPVETFLEVASLLATEGEFIVDWPINASPSKGSK